MSRVLLIAYGNPLRGDDGVGWRVAQALQEAGLAPGVDLITAQQLSPEMASPLSCAGVAIFVDADARGTPGVVQCAPVEATHYGDLASHHLDPQSLLECCQLLYSHAPQAFAVTIAGASFGHCEQLSSAAEAAIPSAVAAIRDLIGKQIARSRNSLDRPPTTHLHFS